MTTRVVSAATKDPKWLVAMLILVLAAPLTIAVARAISTEEAGDDAAVREEPTRCARHVRLGD